MDVETIGVIGVLIMPIYYALFGIYQKIGKYEEVCKNFDEHCHKYHKEEENVSV